MRGFLPVLDEVSSFRGEPYIPIQALVPQLKRFSVIY